MILLVPKKNRSIIVSIHVKRRNEEIPKQVILLDASLRPVRSKWIKNFTCKFHKLIPGIYLVRLTLASGTTEEKIVDLREESLREITFSLTKLSPFESHEWVYLLTRNRLNDNRDFLDRLTVRQDIVMTRLLTLQDGYFQPVYGRTPEILDDIGMSGRTFTIDLMEGIGPFLLEITGEQVPKKCVCLPLQNRVRVFVDIVYESNTESRTFEVVVNSESWASESLLSLMTTGSIGRAESLVKAKIAEELLFKKMENPAAAAVGGYFLLNVGDFRRLHDWANNLANRFPTMPDGCIIHAWQMISDAKRSPSRSLFMIRNRLLQAVERGIPVYLEGLKLLFEGLCILNYEFNKQDEQINKALDIVKHYIHTADFRCGYSTFSINELPDHSLGDGIINDLGYYHDQIQRLKNADVSHYYQAEVVRNNIQNQNNLLCYKNEI